MQCFKAELLIRIRVFWSDPVFKIWLDPNPVQILRFEIYLKIKVEYLSTKVSNIYSIITIKYIDFHFEIKK